MSESYPRIRIPWERGGGLAVREAVRLCFYMRRTHRELGPSVPRALEAYERAVGPRALAWYSDEEGDWQELDAQGRALLREQLLEHAGTSIDLQDDPAGRGEFRFTYQGAWLEQPAAAPPERVSAACFWLSTEYLEAHGPQRVHALALALAAELPFDSGHAGLALMVAEGPGLLQSVRDVCLRHPGLDISNTALDSLHLGRRVQGVHWVNFLGPPVLGALGGVEGLRSRLSTPGTSVRPLGPERAVVTLGPRPLAGDTLAGETLPAWRELARLLAPWLLHRPEPLPSLSEEDTLRWERRLLQ